MPPACSFPIFRDLVFVLTIWTGGVTESRPDASHNSVIDNSYRVILAASDDLVHKVPSVERKRSGWVLVMASVSFRIPR